MNASSHRLLESTALFLSPWILISATVAAAELPPGTSLSPRGDDELEALGDWLEEQCRLHSIPGLAVAVISEEGVVLEKLIGYADPEQEIAVTRETVFPIGSASKPFTSTLAAMLESDGTIDWDDPVTRYLPYFVLPIDSPEKDAKVTLRDLLSHRTGFFTMDLTAKAANWQQDPDYDVEQRLSREGLLRAAMEYEPITPFRERHNYSNVSMLAAGMACGVAAKQDWDALIVERMFEPLGMDDSSTSLAKIRPDQQVAIGFIGFTGTMEPAMPIDLDMVAPAGGLNSTLEDVTTWMQFLLARGQHGGRRLASEEALLETWAPHVPGADLGGMLPGAEYGLGWFVRTWKDHTVVEHGGNSLGFSAMVALIPERGVGFVMLSSALPNPLQNSLGDRVWEALIEVE